MPRYDLSPPELERYDPQLEAPPDLEAFWGQTLEETRAHALDPTATRIETWATAGYAHLVVDTRGQGSGWAVGDTPDPAGSAPAQPGFLTRGITDPADYYYRRVYADAVRAVEFMQAQAGVDPTAIAVTGASQGGGLTLAAAALADGVAALFSVALMDEICPPSTVYAAFNAYGGPKQIVAYPYNDHEGGEAFHRRRQVTWLADLLPSSIALSDLAERADHDGPAATRR